MKTLITVAILIAVTQTAGSCLMDSAENSQIIKSVEYRNAMVAK